MDGAPPPMPDGKRQEKVPGFVWLLVALGILVLAGMGGLWAIFSRMAAEPAISAKAFVERLSDGKDPKWLVVSRDENNRPLLLDLKRGNEKFAVDLSAIDNNRVKVTGDNYIFSIGDPWTAPDWVPVYAEARLKTLRQVTGREHSVDFEVLEPKQALRWYEEALSGNGFSVEKLTPIVLNAKTKSKYVSIIAEPSGVKWIIHVVY